MTNAELIELLRSKQICTGFKPDGHGDVNVVYGPDPVTAEAADRIEALAADRENRLADLRIIKAERDRLREALAIIDAIDPEHHIDGCALTVVRGLVLRMGETARAALKGEAP